MRIPEKILVITGLALLAGPFGFSAQAQDYVDLEAERAAAAQTTSPGDPYAPRGAQSYPATSYGVGSAPAAPAVAAATPAAGIPASQPVAQQAPSQDQNQNLGMLFMQIQQLQQQVMQLNGRIEEQANELRTLREQSLQRYVDLDKRISGAAEGGAVAAAPGAVNAPAEEDASLVIGPAVAGTAPVAAQPGEDEAYRAAYSLVQAQKFDQAVQAFQKFQRDYPAGKYAPNAYYWLGELYLVIQPPDLESSRQSFAMLLSQYPDNSKAPDALYKLGKVQYMKGNREKAKEYLDQVISRYGTTNSSAVKLARDFLAENY